LSNGASFSAVFHRTKQSKKMLTYRLLLLCSLVAVLTLGHEPHELGPDHDRHLHESQIPPPNQQPSKADIEEMLKEIFAKIDKDNDGQVDGEELKEWLETIHHRLIDENISQQWSYYNPQ